MADTTLVTPRPMTVGQLLGELAGVPADTPIELYADPEGNEVLDLHAVRVWRDGPRQQVTLIPMHNWPGGHESDDR